MSKLMQLLIAAAFAAVSTGSFAMSHGGAAKGEMKMEEHKEMKEEHKDMKKEMKEEHKDMKKDMKEEHKEMMEEKKEGAKAK